VVEPEAVRMSRMIKQFLAEGSPPLMAGLIRMLALTLRYRLKIRRGFW